MMIQLQRNEEGTNDDSASDAKKKTKIMALHTDSNANVNKARIVINCKKVNENSGSELSMSPFDVCWLMQNARFKHG